MSRPAVALGVGAEYTVVFAVIMILRTGKSERLSGMRVRAVALQPKNAMIGTFYDKTNFERIRELTTE
jgi:hypothetical protein